ncbi:MAG: hypothetical protein WD382_06975 [Halofilum sp. (in: g-proteobacteria)]
MSAPDFAWRRLREQGVAVLDAAAFGARAASHGRIAYIVDEARLEEACRRTAAFCTAGHCADTGVS